MVSFKEKRGADMSYWIHIAVLFQSLTNAENVLYVGEGRISSVEASSLCNLATPKIHFNTNRHTFLLDGTNLNISDGGSVWSGYVQTYAAFLYEGCYEEGFVNSLAKYTNMYKDPGNCYSRCKTDVIGIQATTCHCNPRTREAKPHATACNIICSNPDGTVCGGNKAVSVYKKVQYPGSDGRAATENCRAFHWEGDVQHFYTWRSCLFKYQFICESDATTSATFWHYKTWCTWRAAAGWCVFLNQTPASELVSNYPVFNVPGSNTAWIGQIRSHVIGNDKDSNYQTPGWRRGVILKARGEHWLHFPEYSTALKPLCENVLRSPQPSDSTYKTTQRTDISSSTTTPTTDHHDSEQKSNTDESPQFPMTVVYVAVPVVLVLVAVIVFVILCKRRHASKKRTLSPGEHQGACVTKPSYPAIGTRDPEGAVAAARGDEYAVVTKKTKTKQPVTIDDNEYDTTVSFSSLKHAETDNTYNRLDDVTGNTREQICEDGGNEVDIYDHAVSKDKPLKASKGRNTFQNDTTVTFSSLKHTGTDNRYNRLDEVTGNADTHESDGDTTDLYDHVVSTDRSLKASKEINKDQGGLYDTALAVNKQGETQTNELQDIYAQPIPRSQRK